MKKKLSGILAVVFTLGFLVSGWMIYQILRDAHAEKQSFDQLAKMVASAPENPPKQIAPADQTEPAVGEQTVPAEEAKPSPYAPLKEENPDFFGWLSIQDTVLNYPVMYTPEDPEHYLHRDFYGKDSVSGVPFLSAACYEGCGNYLVYGHHMKNGSMFASLLKYAKKSYWEEHPVIRFDTLTETGEYEVIGAFYAQVYALEDKSGFRYYDYTDLSREEDFEEYVRLVKNAALYDTGVEAVSGDTLLTLSTCSYHTEEGRFVVVARKSGSGSSR